MTLSGTRYDWLSLDSYPSKAFALACNSWLGTPYRPHQRIKGVGADCKELTLAVLDRLYGKISPTCVTRLSPNVASHCPERARIVVAQIRRAYPCSLVKDGTIEEGDVLVSRSNSDAYSPQNEGHIMLAWKNPGCVFDITNGSRARISSIQCNRPLIGVYRLEGKDLWD